MVVHYVFQLKLAKKKFKLRSQNITYLEEINF